MDDTFASSPRHDAYAARRYARLDVARGPARPAPPAPSKPAARPEPTAADVLLDLDFRRLFGYLARRKLWIAAAAVIGVGAGLAYGVLAPARYTATAEVLVDPSSLQVVSNDLYSSSGQTDAMVLNVESKMRVLTSNQVFARVVDQLHLTADPEFTSYRTLAPEDSALKVMQDIVKVSRDDKSFVVTLSATTSNGEPEASGVRRSRAAARALAPIPPRNTTGSKPLPLSAAVSSSRCAVHWVSTRQCRPRASAASTSATTCAVRASSATRSR